MRADPVQMDLPPLGPLTLGLRLERGGDRDEEGGPMKALGGLTSSSRSLAADWNHRPDPAAVERGRIALTQTGHLRPAWKGETYSKVGKLWGVPHPDPKADPAGYAAAFNRRYGLHPAPYPNDGLPMGLRRGVTKDGRKVGIQIDCMACHGGSIGGTSYVGLGNTTLDLKSPLRRPDPRRGRGGRRSSTFTLNTTRGTVNAGQVAAVLISFRNPDWSRAVDPASPRRQSCPRSTRPPGGSSAARRRCTTTAGPTPTPSGRTCNSSWPRSRSTR